MDTGFISAVAALAGAAIGGTMSFLGSWVVQRRKVRADWLMQDRSRRQELYKEFIEEAAKCYVDAVQQIKPDIASLVVLYAKMSRMRIISSPPVLAAGEEVLKKIVETYSQPQIALTAESIRTTLEEGRAIDVLKEFGNACREEFELVA